MMKVINPDTQDTGKGRQTTTGFARFMPTEGKLVEAGFVFFLAIAAFIGYRTTFDSWFFLAVVAIGLVLGIAIAYLVKAAKWHWTAGLAGAVAAYFLLGGPVALRRDLVARVIPTWSTFQQLWSMAIGGWKQLLTTMPPVNGQGPFLALPFLVALVFGAAGYGIARSYRWLAAPLVTSGVMFFLVVFLGARYPGPWIAQTAAWVVLALAWGAYRSHQQTRLATATTGIVWPRALAGAGVAGLAAVLATLAAPVVPGIEPPRHVLRDYMTPPVDFSQYPSPMPTFRKFSSKVLADQYYYDSELMKVDGAEPGTLLRFAVLDSYDGRVWGAGSGHFLAIGTVIPAEVDGVPVRGETKDITITIGDVYARQGPLNIWVPSLGYATAIGFDGSNKARHTDSLAYDLDKGQGAVLDQLKPGDVIKVSSIPMPVNTGGEALTEAGRTFVPEKQTDFIEPSLNKMTGGNLSRWDQLANMAKVFKDGAWSDGTEDKQGQYMPGSGQARLLSFMATLPKCVGSDEQYAAMFALVANRIGFPARVVFGARMPASGDVVKGKDVTIWVEVRTAGGWVALPPEFFIPDRDKPPDQNPDPEPPPPDQIQDIAPPNPKNPDDSDINVNTHAQAQPPAPPPAPVTWPAWVRMAVTAGSVVGGLGLLVALLLGAKAVRALVRRRTGSPAKQISRGWTEVMDRVRDMGLKVPRRLTWQEQAAALGLAPLGDLATATDRAMFQPTPPDQRIVDAYWDLVRNVKATLLADKKGLARFWARLTPRSFLPRSQRV